MWGQLQFNIFTEMKRTDLKAKISLLFILLTAAAFPALANREASDIEISDVEYSNEIEYYMSPNLSCVATNKGTAQKHADFYLAITSEEYEDFDLAVSKTRSIQIGPDETESLLFDDCLQWKINCIPPTGKYIIRIADTTTREVYYSGEINLLSPVTSVEMTEAGKLSELIGGRKYDITDLRVSGEINGTDIRLLRDMAGSDENGSQTAGRLSSLCLKNATVVEGGDYYYHDSLFGYQYAIPKSISNFMFFECGALSSLVMPADTEYVGQWAFTNSALSHIEFSESLQAILSYAFRGTDIRNLTLPESVTELGDMAFSNCKNLMKVSIGSNLKHAEAPFAECPLLKSISVSEDNPYLTDIDGVLYSKDLSTLIGYPNAHGEEYELPSATAKIARMAFFKNDAIRALKCEDELLEIGSEAFEQSSIETISLGARLQLIGAAAFNLCTNLKKIKCLALIPPTCENSFTNISSDVILYVPDDSVELYKKADGWKSFNYIEPESAVINELAIDPTEIFEIYSIDGSKLKEPKRGSVNIIRMSDGSVRKMIM